MNIVLTNILIRNSVRFLYKLSDTQIKGNTLTIILSIFNKPKLIFLDQIREKSGSEIKKIYFWKNLGSILFTSSNVITKMIRIIAIELFKTNDQSE